MNCNLSDNTWSESEKMSVDSCDMAGGCCRSMSASSTRREKEQGLQRQLFSKAKA